VESRAHSPHVGGGSIPANTSIETVRALAERDGRKSAAGRSRSEIGRRADRDFAVEAMMACPGRTSVPSVSSRTPYVSRRDWSRRAADRLSVSPQLEQRGLIYTAS